MEGLAIDSSRNLFAITSNNKLYNIDVTTGAASLIGDTGRTGGIEGLDFFGDVLYGIDFNGFGDYNQRVFSINTLNAATVDVAELQNPEGIIRAPTSMAALNSTTMLITPYLGGQEGYSYLYSVDLTTNATTQIGPIVVPGDEGYDRLFIGGLDFAPDGTLYGIGLGMVVQINPNTAQATVIGYTGSQLWLGLAIPSERPLGALPASQCINLCRKVNPETGLPEKFSAKVRNDFDGCIIEASVIFYKSFDCTGTAITHSFE